MCGIFGTTKDLTQDETRKILNLLDHRGPDSSGSSSIQIEAQALTLCHTRLSIQDLSSHGHQPMQSKCGRWLISFNGEIYNHFEMRQELNINFLGNSDTETLVEYISKYGVDKCVKRLNGIFSIAVFDSLLKKLYLVRDSFGVKPLYYAWSNGYFSFSSELKPILQVNPELNRLSEVGLSTFLSLRYIPSPNTLFESISRLPPGHILSICLKSKEERLERYIQVSNKNFAGSLNDATEEYYSLVKKAVHRQLLSDVPVGVLLSGGIDSALVAAIASEKMPDIHSYTVGFGESHKECEIDDARETAEILGINHKSVRIDSDQMLEAIPNIIKSIEEPLGTTSIMPMWFLSELAKNDTTVVLTGQGCDEPWGGYKRYQIELILEKLKFLKHPVFGPIGSSASNLFKNEPIKRGLRCLGEPDIKKRFLKAYSLFEEKERFALLGTKDKATLPIIDYWVDWAISSESGISNSECETMMAIDSRMNLSDDLLLYGDKISMKHSLEARVPLLDRELVEFVESLPLKYKTNLFKTKIAHKHASQKYLPAAIVNRKKKGFEVPFEELSRTVWRESIEAYLLDKSNKIYQYIDYTEVLETWNMHITKRSNYSKQIFSLFTLSIWSNQFL